MNKLEETLSELKNLMTLDLPREEFLAICVKARLEEQVDKYNKLFDKFLRNLEIKESGKDLEKLSHSLVVLSDTMVTTYSHLLKELKKLEGLVK